jgi:tRNA-Thr(GGU) m(6)t(6)A37 methyltransferase TsaA
MNLQFKPIGTIHSPHHKIEGMPIQPVGAAGVRGSVEIYPEYVDGLKDLDGFSHIILLYFFHEVNEHQLTVIPFLDSTPRGVFATRAPKRPNPIGLSVVKLIGIQNNRLTIENVDILDNTPLLDIKPYVPDFDHFQADRIGWLSQSKGRVQTKKSDERFR